MPKELVMAELTKYDVNSIKVDKRKFKTWSIVKITIVSQDTDKAPERMTINLHCRDQNGKNKIPTIKMGKVEIVE